MNEKAHHISAKCRQPIYQQGFVMFCKCWRQNKKTSQHVALVSPKTPNQDICLEKNKLCTVQSLFRKEVTIIFNQPGKLTNVNDIVKPCQTLGSNMAQSLPSPAAAPGESVANPTRGRFGRQRRIRWRPRNLPRHGHQKMVVLPTKHVIYALVVSK